MHPANRWQSGMKCYQKKKNASCGVNNSWASQRRPQPSARGQTGSAHPGGRHRARARVPWCCTHPPTASSCHRCCHSATCCHGHQAINSSGKRSVVKPQKLIFRMAARLSFLKSKSDSITPSWPDLSQPHPTWNNSVLSRAFKIRALQDFTGPTCARHTPLGLVIPLTAAWPALSHCLARSSSTASARRHQCPLQSPWAGSSPLSQEHRIHPLLPDICHVCKFTFICVYPMKVWFSNRLELQRAETLPSFLETVFPGTKGALSTQLLLQEWVLKAESFSELNPNGHSRLWQLVDHPQEPWRHELYPCQGTNAKL